MDDLRLVKPSKDYEKGFRDFCSDWAVNDPAEVPWYARIEPNFPSVLRMFADYERGVNLPEGFVPNSTFWLVDASARVLGAVNIRHRLEGYFLQYAGHIGYGIRPCARGKGYGTEILRLGLIEAKKLGLKRAMVCSYLSNTRSVRVIEGNGGVLESTVVDEDGVTGKYWIDL